MSNEQATQEAGQRANETRMPHTVVSNGHLYLVVPYEERHGYEIIASTIFPRLCISTAPMHVSHTN